MFLLLFYCASPNRQHQTEVPSAGPYLQNKTFFPLFWLNLRKYVLIQVCFDILIYKVIQAYCIPDM